MASWLGSIEHFDVTSGNLKTYLERFDQFCEVNSITDNKKTPLFITMAGPALYETARTVCAPDLPKEKEFQELVYLLNSLLSPKKSVIMERYTFNKVMQEEGESITNFVVRLRKLSESCDFREFREEALRDRFVVGLQNEKTRAKLLIEETIDFKTAIKIALAAETAEKQSSAIQEKTLSFIKEKNKTKFPTVIEDSKKWIDRNNKTEKCQRCGRVNPKHREKNCPALNWNCYSCGKKGHVSIMCSLSKRHVKNVKVHSEYGNSENECESEVGSLSDEDLLSFKVVEVLKGIHHSAFLTKLKINEVPVKFEVDTGASVTVMSLTQFKRLFPTKKLKSCTSQLKSVIGEKLQVTGEIKVNVEGKQHAGHWLRLIVLETDLKSPLVGRDWLNVIFPGWSKSFILTKELTENKVQTIDQSERESFIEFCKRKFQDACGKNKNPIKGYKANIVLKEDAIPVFHKAYSVPFALLPEVNKELDRLLDEGIIEPVKSSEWASPVCVVPKPNGTLRLCVDFKRTVNKAVEVDYYPLPKLEEVFTTLAGAKVFTVLDLSQAYLQLEVSELSKKYLTINTCRGLFRFKRLCFGINSAPAIFQSIMDEMLRNIANVKAYLDDIIITGRDISECKKKVLEVLEVLNNHNVKLNLEKCHILRDSVEYLGHRVDKNGIHPTKGKLEAVENAPEPTNVTQVKSFLGLINFYHSFLPNSSFILKPLYDLTRKNVKFVWSQQCKDAFLKAKKLLINNACLSFYDPKYPIILACDASPYGAGAVISQLVEGKERPVAFASCTFSPTVCKYSQLEKEAYAIVFGIRKFHRYLYGQKFTLYSDHQPLKFLFNPNKGIPVLSNVRVQRWAMFLSAYQYEIRYRKANQMQNADAMSRLPQPEILKEVNSFNLIGKLPLTYKEISKSSQKDLVLTKVMDLVLNGWPNYLKDKSLEIYFRKRNELSLECGCLMLGHRVVIPDSLKSEVLKLLHEGHPGIVRTKMLARSFVWWYKMDEDIENLILSCEVCQLTQNKTTSSFEVIWPKTQKVFERVHIDLLEKYNVKMLILYDSFSKWLEVWLCNSTNAQSILSKIQGFCAIFGLPKQIVSDNGPPFNSEEYRSFLSANGVQELHSPPFHPKSNGLAERGVQTIKKMLVREVLETKRQNYTLQQKLLNCLFNYRNTPSTTTGFSPAEMIFKVKPRTKLSLLKPEFGQRNNKSHSEFPIKISVFTVGERVLVKTDNQKGKETNWEPGEIKEVVSKTTYLVQVRERIRFVHADQLKHTKVEQPLLSNQRSIPAPFPNPQQGNIHIPQPFTNLQLRTPTKRRINEEIPIEEGTTENPCHIEPQSKEKEYKEQQGEELELRTPEKVVDSKNNQNNMNDKENDPRKSQTQVSNRNLRPRSLLKPPDRLNYKTLK